MLTIPRLYPRGATAKPAKRVHLDRCVLRQPASEAAREAASVIHEVVVRPTVDRGQGVFALRSFSSGELVFRRRHVPLTPEQVRDLPAAQRHHVCLVGPGRHALVTPPGCFVNHSCDPSAVRHGVSLLALTQIAEGEEITLDYRLNALDGPAWECRCGTARCTGVVAGGVGSLPPEVRERLGAHVPRWLRRATDATDATDAV